MKTTVTQAAPIEPRPLTYPILMQNKHYHEMVVLFVSETAGVRVASAALLTYLLTYQMETDWRSADDSEHWRPFAGTIILQNDPEQLL